MTDASPLCTRCGSEMKKSRVPFKPFGYFVGIYDGYKCAVCGDILFSREGYEERSERAREIYELFGQIPVQVESSKEIRVLIPSRSASTTEGVLVGSGERKSIVKRTDEGEMTFSYNPM